MPGIQAMLADAGEKQSGNPAVKQWLAALKDVAYDAEDVIDEWNTEILWRKANSTGDMIGFLIRPRYDSCKGIMIHLTFYSTS